MAHEKKEMEKIKLSVDEEASIDLKEIDDEADKNSSIESGLDSIEASPTKGKVQQPESFPIINDRYTVLEFIGSGGMGAVYKVFDRELGIDQAIKILRAELVQDSTAVKRFKSQVEVVSDLEHDGLVDVHGYGETTSGEPYVVMDFVRGKTLQDVLEEEEKLDAKRAVKIFVKIAEALVYAHGKGLIHRDIKPSNIMITESVYGEDEVCIVDFGIAQVAQGPDDSSTITHTGEVLGSALYMSPEQCRGKKVDERSDIYSLGCVMYEVLLGEQPFKGANPVLTILNHLENPMIDVPVITGDTKYDGWLKVIILRCVELLPERRYEKIDLLLSDLQQIVKGKPPEGEPIENSFARWFKHHEKRLGAPAGLLLGGLSLLGIYSGVTLLPVDQFGFFLVLIFALNIMTFLYGLYRYINQPIKPPEAEYFSGILTLSLIVISFVLCSISIFIPSSDFEVFSLVELFVWSFIATIGSSMVYCYQWQMRRLKAHKIARVAVNVSLVMLLFFCHSAFAVVISLSGQAWLAKIHSQNVKLKRATSPWTVQTAISVVDFALLIEPDDEYSNRFKAKSYIYLKEYDKALDAINKAIAINPKASRLYVIRSQIHEKQNNTEEVLNDYSKVLKYSNASKEGIYCDRAEVFFKAGYFKKALQDYNKAIAINPSYQSAYIGRGRCLVELGQLNDGISSFSTAIELNKDSYEALYHRGLAYIKVNKSHLGYKDLHNIMGRYIWKGSPKSKADLEYFKYLVSKEIEKSKTRTYIESLDKLGYKIGNDGMLKEKFPGLSFF